MQPLGETEAAVLGDKAVKVFTELATKREALDAEGQAGTPMNYVTHSPTPASEPSQPALTDGAAAGPSANWLEMLAVLPPTDVLLAEYDELHGRHERAVSEGAPGTASRIRFVLERAEQRVAWGKERDAIQATRPEGCFCLGLGGRFPRALPIASGTWTYYDPPCICPEAEAMTAALAAHRTGHQRSLIEARLARVFGSPELDGYEQARMDNVDVDPRNQASWARLQAYVDPNQPDICDKSLLLYGPVGSGKTFAAVAIMRARMELGEMALFLPLARFIETLKASFGRAADGSDGPTTDDVLSAPRQVQFLVLDDLGAEYGTAWVESQVLELVNARRTKPTLFTTNILINDLHDGLGDRIASRVIGMCGGLGGNVCEWEITGLDRRLGAPP